MAGLQVLATTRNPQKRALLLEKGADKCLTDDGRLHEVLGNAPHDGVNAAIEIVGAAMLRDTIQADRPIGRIAILGLLGGREIERFDVYGDLRNGVSVSYVSSEHIGRPYQPIEDFPLAKIAGAFAFDDLSQAQAQAQAHAYAESNQVAGKTVIVL
ncbi:zinc-binding dehydrogenase [Paraburkholderia phymatum]|uniref:zinc-binding dehydrogenase n=1 Tax=Paraburkholderia phymatum TaxID=148447 RepID=UPI003176402B